MKNAEDTPWRDRFDVADRVAVVTGGLGQLGREFALELLHRHAYVAVLGRTATTEQVSTHFPAEFVDTRRVKAYAVDITNRESIVAALADIRAQWGVPEILINNAGIDTQPSAPPEVSGPFETFPEDVFREVIEVNLTGTFLTCQVIGGAMAEAGRGSIINIGSIYGILSPVQDIYAYKEELTGKPFIKPVAYSASKSGLYNLTRYLATYWAKRGVRVNILTPSGVYRESQDDQFVQNYCNRMPMGRMATATEYNGAIVFLSSDASGYMTGSNLVIDGGWSAW